MMMDILRRQQIPVSEEAVALYEQVDVALTMTDHLDVFDCLIRDDDLESYLLEGMREVYGSAAHEAYLPYLDRDRLVEDAKADYGEVTLEDCSWWYRK
jgi:hypothetical protein